jgi:hypothetical protein
VICGVVGGSGTGWIYTELYPIGVFSISSTLMIGEVLLLNILSDLI